MGEDFVEQQGIPICDFKIYNPNKTSIFQKFRRVVQLVKRFNQL